MVVIRFTPQTHENLIVTALEGGSNYWYYLSDKAINIIEERTKNSEEPFSIRFWKALKKGAIIPINDAEDPDTKIGSISMTSIIRGEQLMSNKSPRHFADIIQDNADSITADVWFQYACLGEVIYG